MKLFARITCQALQRLIHATSLALAVAGCDDAKEKAIGIIGGEGGPTAIY